MKSIVLIAFFFLTMSMSYGQTQDTDITGTWLNDKKDAHVEIYQKEGKFYGKIVWLQEPNTTNGEPKTDKNNPKKSLRNRKILGIDIISDLYFNGHIWEDGTVYLPKKGQEANCSIKISDDQKELTLHITKLWFSTDITWTRLK
ncbi:DUF2147 domain-containing protein [Allomuricauda sp. M10]|uniref:DUF2147 domain-containing protein n=1 Tax=Allomuricauda sp. M10 TaxID=2683292 RepID=UPI001D18D249|nr:DUF2147 domain-containing protein [Muricauda sp. M10]